MAAKTMAPLQNSRNDAINHRKSWPN